MHNPLINMSPKREEISLQIRKLVIADCKKKLSNRKIVDKFVISKSAVGKIYKKYLKYGIVENLHRTGKNRLTTVHDNRQIVRECRKYPIKTSRKIIEDLNLSISSRTTSCGAKMGLQEGG